MNKSLLLLCAVISMSAYAQVYEYEMDIPPNADTYVYWRQSIPEREFQNYGNQPSMTSSAWTGSGYPMFLRIYMYFDLKQSLPAGATIEEATLFLFGDGHDYHTHQTNNDAYLHKVDAYWEEMTITWNNAPSFTPNISTDPYIPTSTSPNQNYQIDITNWAIESISENEPLNYAIVQATEEHWRRLRFCTKEHEDPDKRPFIRVKYKINQYHTFYPEADALVARRDQQPGVVDQNFGDVDRLMSWIWTASSQPFIQRTYMYFDVSNYDLGGATSVAKAELMLFGFNSPPYDIHNYYGTASDNDAYLHKVDDSWGEMTITWNNAPSYTQNLSTDPYLPGTTNPAKDYIVDVTDWVNEALQADDPLNFALIQNGSTTYRSLAFCSKEHADSTKHPYLRINKKPVENVPIPVFSGGSVRVVIDVNDPNTGDINYGGDGKCNALAGGFSRSFSEDFLIERTYFSFDFLDIGLPENAVIDNVTLHLYSRGEHSGYPNNGGFIHRALANWDEQTITWNNAPAFDVETTDPYLPPTDDPNKNYTINVQPEWVSEAIATQEPLNLVLKLEDESGGPKNLSFYCREALQAPIVMIEYHVPNPGYALLKRKLDGEAFYLNEDELKIRMDERYPLEPSADMNYVIYNQSGVEVGSLPVVPIHKGANYINIDLSSTTAQVNQFYTLVVKGAKGEERFLRFKYK